MYLWGFFKTFTILCAYVICLWLVITGLYVAVHMIVSKIRRRNEQETKRKAFQKKISKASSCAARAGDE